MSDKYQILYHLTQAGWKMGKQQMGSSTLTYNDRTFHTPYKLILIWNEMKYIHHSPRKSMSVGVSFLLNRFGFTEQKLPNE